MKASSVQLRLRNSTEFRRQWQPSRCGWSSVLVTAAAVECYFAPTDCGDADADGDDDEEEAAAKEDDEDEDEDDDDSDVVPPSCSRNL